MAPRLDQVFTLRVALSKDGISLGPIKDGPTRFAVPINQGTLEGSGVKGTLVEGGGDWLMVDTSVGVGHMDVRMSIRTDADEFIICRFSGVIKMDEAVQITMSG